MRVIACVREVPDPRLAVEIDPRGGGDIALEGMAWVVNPADACAVEEAVRLKERHGGVVTVLTAGPPRVEKTLRRCLALGADRALRLWEAAFECSDALAVATILARAIDRIGYDLVLCGSQSTDIGTGFVGPALAELLGVAQLTRVTSIEVAQDMRTARFQRKLERGNREEVECELPAVVAVEDTLNQPRYASLPQWMWSLRAPIEVWDAASLGVSYMEVGIPRVKVVNLALPRPRTKKVFTPDASLPPEERMKLLMSGGIILARKSNLLEGDAEQIADKIVEFLKQQKILREERG